MCLRVTIWLILICFPIFIQSETNTQDVSALLSLKQLWQKFPPSWNASNDPCDNLWEGIGCRGSRVISITLSSMGLMGQLPGDLQGLLELNTLDLSYNKELSGHLPAAIGKLPKLVNLILAGCSFNGEIPDAIGSLSELAFLSLNSNSFSGAIPLTIGNLTKLYWLDFAGNKFTGTIPVSNGTIFGLDALVNAKHMNFGRNQLSGEIPPQLFNEKMTLVQLLLDNNQFSGSIPTTVGLVTTLEAIRLDWNSLVGPVPSSVNALTSLSDMLFSNNKLDGLIPDLTGMNRLSYLDMSNNSFEVSDVPLWITALPSLTTLIMEQSQIQGTVPSAFFGLPQLQTVVLKNNKLNDTIDLGGVRSPQLQLVDLQNNDISAYTQQPADISLQLLLEGNPVCADVLAQQSRHCILPLTTPSYSTPQKGAPVTCNTTEISSPICRCSRPYTGILTLSAPQFSNLHNTTYYETLENELMSSLQSNKVPIDSLSLSNVASTSSNYLDITLQIFPAGQIRFNRTAISTIGYILSSQTFKPPSYYGPYTFLADEYLFSDGRGPKPKSKLLAIIGGILGLITMILAALGAHIYFKNNNINICNCCNVGKAKSESNTGFTNLKSLENGGTIL